MSGKDLYRLETALKRVLKENSVHKDHTVEFDGSDQRSFRMDAAIMECDTFSLFEGSDRKAVIIRDPYFLNGSVKQGKASKKKEDKEEKDRRLQFAYNDVSAAFAYYLANENDGRPIVLAGFSQGSDMVYRLMEEYFGTEEMQEKLVAAYAIGWACTEEMVEKYPQIVPAKSEDDIGVVISFDCEAPEVTETIVNPAGQKAYSINPLNWKTDATPADKSLNIGACFPSSKGEIKSEIEGLCGCYIDEERGALKVTDVMPAAYPPVIDIFPDGAYHIYDYQFFFRNLQENVKHRVELYMEQAAAAEQAA